MKKHTKKPFSGLTASTVLFFYLFSVVGFCYQPHLQFVADSVMFQADNVFPKLLATFHEGTAARTGTAEPQHNEKKGRFNPKISVCPNLRPQGRDKPRGSAG